MAPCAGRGGADGRRHDARYCLDKPGGLGGQPVGAQASRGQVRPGERGKIFAFLSADGVGIKATHAGRADSGFSAIPTTPPVWPSDVRGWNDLSFRRRDSRRRTLGRRWTTPTNWSSPDCRSDCVPSGGTAPESLRPTAPRISRRADARLRWCTLNGLQLPLA